MRSEESIKRELQEEAQRMIDHARNILGVQYGSDEKGKTFLMSKSDMLPKAKIIVMAQLNYLNEQARARNITKADSKTYYYSALEEALDKCY